MPPYAQIAWQGGMALLIGLLIGLERQHSQRGDEPLFAGVRTFPIIVLSGYLSGLLSTAGFTWVLPVALGRAPATRELRRSTLRSWPSFSARSSRWAC